MVKFDWDDNKAISNFKKHKISFEEAKTVFDNPLACIFDDEMHSIGEYRQIIIGHSAKGRLLLVCFVEQVEDVIRIFSAREATKKERRDYEENTGF
jgi:uncharacterized DUF497 family protein